MPEGERKKAYFIIYTHLYLHEEACAPSDLQHHKAYLHINKPISTTSTVSNST
jgi:hypothetical protein